jgi:hypothetical protein
MFPGVRLEKFQPQLRSYFGLASKDEWIFLFMFHFTSVMERKNPLGLIRAFKQAFSAVMWSRNLSSTTEHDMAVAACNSRRLTS